MYSAARSSTQALRDSFRGCMTVSTSPFSQAIMSVEKKTIGIVGAAIAGPSKYLDSLYQLFLERCLKHTIFAVCQQERFCFPRHLIYREFQQEVETDVTALVPLCSTCFANTIKSSATSKLQSDFI